MISQLFSNLDRKHNNSPIVARARPKTSKGITDLLLLPTSSFLGKSSFLKKQQH